ncbi:MAG: hypothetical protein ACE5KZ_10425 [Candidatus Scalinduaceae bacterium]
MYNTSICYGANNYIDILYFLSNSVIYPHIDRMYFSCNSIVDKPEETLFSVLKDNDYKCKYDRWAKRGIYDRIKRYCSSETGINVSILYNCISRRLMYPCMGIIIYKPDIKTVDWFDAICNSFGFLTTLSHVELTIDISPYEYGLQEFFWRHLFLKFHRGNSCFVDNEFGSFYIGHKRKNSKSIILYSKKIDNNNVLRLEFRLNRTYIRKLDLELDCFEKINDINLPDLISFKEINRDKLLKHLMWKNKSRLSAYDEDDKDLLIGQLRDFPSVYGGVANEIFYMKRIPYINNCQRFPEDMSEANNAFFERLKGVKFI